MTITKIANHPGKALQFAVFILQRHCYGIGPESGSIFFGVPAFIPGMTLGSRPLEFFLQLDPQRIAGIKNGYVSANNLMGLIVVNARCTCIPGANIFFVIQKVQRVILHPRWNQVRRAVGGRRLVPHNQNVAHRQHIFLGNILNLTQSSVGTYQRKCALLLALFQKCSPKLGYFRLEVGRGKIVNLVPNDLVSRES